MVHSCPNCGAPLGESLASEQLHCRFCGCSIERQRLRVAGPPVTASVRLRGIFWLMGLVTVVSVVVLVTTLIRSKASPPKVPKAVATIAPLEPSLPVSGEPAQPAGTDATTRPSSNTAPEAA